MELLSKDLRTQTSPSSILPRLKALISALRDDNNALEFVRAGGVPAVIAILRGTAMSHATTMPHATNDAKHPLCLSTGLAGAALKQLVCCKAAMEELSSPQDVILPLIDVMSNAPIDMGRLRAAEALLLLAQGQQANRRAMAEGGVMGPLVALYMKLLEYDWATTPIDWVLQRIETVMKLAHLLISTERAAVHDLRRVILVPETTLSFTALVILKDGLEKVGSHLVPTFNEVRIVDTLVATLKDDQPHCAGLAAVALYLIWDIPAGGQALVEASGAVPALVRLLEKASPPGDPAKDALVFQRIRYCELKGKEGTECVHFSNPTAVAAMVLGGSGRGLLDSRPALNSFVESGGVPALARLLKKSTSPVTFRLTAKTIGRLLSKTAEVLASQSEWPTWPRNLNLADEFYEAGLCQAALHVLKTRAESMQREVLCILVQLIMSRSPPIGSHRTFSATMALLVSGGFVELAIAHIAQAGADMLVWGMALFGDFMNNSEALDRMCKPKTVDSLMSWFAKWLSEVDGTVAIQLCEVLSPLQDKSSCFVSAAIRTNVLPGLVRTLRLLHSRPSIAASLPIPVTISEALQCPLNCLDKLLQYDKEHAGGLWKPATDVGQVLINLFPLVDIPTTMTLVTLSGSVMLLTPKGKVGQLGADLLREIAQLLTGSAPPVIRASATKVLLDSFMMHPELTADCHTWGIENSVRRLTLDSNPGIAKNAKQLVQLLFGVAQDEHQQDRRTGAPASTWPSRPGTKSGGTPDSSSMDSGNRHTARAASHATPHQDVPLETPALKQPAEKASSTGAVHGRQRKGTVRACACCGITADKLESGGKLKECSACRSVHYCGTVCQKTHWQEHRVTCKRLQPSRA